MFITRFDGAPANAVQINTKQRNAMQSNAQQRRAIQSNAKQCETKQRKAMKRKTIQSSSMQINQSPLCKVRCVLFYIRPDVNIHHKWFEFDGNRLHSARTFTGERLPLVYYVYMCTRQNPHLGDRER